MKSTPATSTTVTDGPNQQLPSDNDVLPTNDNDANCVEAKLTTLMKPLGRPPNHLLSQTPSQ